MVDRFEKAGRRPSHGKTCRGDEGHRESCKASDGRLIGNLILPLPPDILVISGNGSKRMKQTASGGKSRRLSPGRILFPRDHHTDNHELNFISGARDVDIIVPAHRRGYRSPDQETDRRPDHCARGYRQSRSGVKRFARPRRAAISRTGDSIGRVGI